MSTYLGSLPSLLYDRLDQSWQTIEHYGERVADGIDYCKNALKGRFKYYAGENASYCVGNVISNLLEALLLVNPVGVFIPIGKMVSVIFPRHDASRYTVIREPSDIAKFVKKELEIRSFDKEGCSLEGEKLIKAIEQAALFKLECFKKIKEQSGVKADLALTICRSYGEDWCHYGAIGTSYSLKTPIVYAALPSLLELKSIIDWLGEDTENAVRAEMERDRNICEFLFGHECSHIAHSDVGYRVMVGFVQSLPAIFLWHIAPRYLYLAGVNSPFYLLGIFAWSLTFGCLKDKLSRCQEARADLDACKLLQDGSGGEKFFSHLLETSPINGGYQHPDHDVRLEAIQNWSPVAAGA